MQQYSDVVLVASVPGGPVRAPAAASVQVNITGGAAATLYSDNGITPRANPVIADSSGEYSFYAANGTYDLVISVTGFTTETKTAAVQLFDAAASSGASGIGFLPSGTGAISRPVQTKLREIEVSITDFGAAIDTTTDDTTKIQAALDAVRSAGGGVVTVPYGSTGISKITAQIKVGSNTRLVGTGGTIKLVANSSTNAIVNYDQVSGNSKVVIENLTVLGPEDGTMTTANGTDTGKGIYLKNCDDSAVFGCNVSRFWLQGIQVDASARVKVFANTVKEIKAGNGISVDDSCIDIIVLANNLKDIADCAVATHNGSTGTIILSNDVTKTNFGRGIDVAGAPNTLVQGNKLSQIGFGGVSGNAILLSIGTGGSAPHGCSIIDNLILTPLQNGVAVSATAAINDILIANNPILAAGDKGVYIAGLANNVSVLGNPIKGSAGAAVYIEHSGANIPTRIWIDGNQLIENGTYGIHATSAVASLRIGQNDLTANTLAPTNIPTPTVVSTAALTLPVHNGLVSVTSTNNITSIVAGGVGETVTLLFAGILTFTDGSNLKLAGNFATSANATIGLICDGTNWIEQCRSTN